jgi:hypothetical protein
MDGGSLSPLFDEITGALIGFLIIIVPILIILL